MSLPPTASQTVGPYFHIGLPYEGGELLVDPDHPAAVRIRGTVTDGEGEPVPDSMIELWQAGPGGRYAHPEDTREDVPLEQGFSGFGRAAVDESGSFEFVTLKPGAVPAPEGGTQAPHINVSVFARGLLRHLPTRLYFPDEAEANDADPVLSSIEPARRATLVAVEEEDGALRFDVRLQGEAETVFFDV